MYIVFFLTHKERKNHRIIEKNQVNLFKFPGPVGEGSLVDALVEIRMTLTKMSELDIPTSHKTGPGSYMNSYHNFFGIDPEDTISNILQLSLKTMESKLNRAVSRIVNLQRS